MELFLLNNGLTRIPFIVLAVLFISLAILSPRISSAQCTNYFTGGPSIVCVNQNPPPAYFVSGGNTSGCSVASVSGSGNSVGTGNTIIWGAVGSWQITFSCSCGTAFKNVTVESASIAGGSISNSAQTICSGGSPIALSTIGYSGYVTGWEKKRPAESTWTSVGYSSNPLPSGYINNAETFQYRMNVANNCGGTSNTSIATVSVISVPLPSVPLTDNTNPGSCGSQTLRISGAPPSGVTWYWQGTTQAANSSPSANASNNNYSVTSSGTYFLGANIGSCWAYSSIAITNKSKASRTNTNSCLHCNRDSYRMYHKGNQCYSRGS